MAVLSTANPPSDLANIEVDGMVKVFKMAVTLMLAIPFRFDFTERFHGSVGRIDRIDARFHLAIMGWAALYLDLEPEHTDIGANQHVFLWLRDDHRVRFVATQQGGQGTVARALFLDHGLEIDRCTRRVACSLDRIECEQVGHQPGFHIGRTAAIQPTVNDCWIPRRARPPIHRASRYHVDMPVQDQRTPGLPFRPIGAHHVESVLVRDGNRAEARVGLDVLDIDLPSIHRQAALVHRLVQEVLGGVLLLAERRDTLDPG